MEKMEKKRFKWRGMMTMLVALTLLVDAVSGVILYITPLGRFANWTNWTLWGLSKGEWRSIHMIFSLLLILIIVGHLYFNWRVLVHFFWSKIQHTVNLKKELAVATAIILAVFIGTLWNIQPFSSVTDFREKAKFSWERGDNAAQGTGYGRRAFSDNAVQGTGYGRGALMNGKQGRGGGNVTSQPVPHVEPISYSNRSRGFGRMTIELACNENGLPVDEGLSRLKDNGIQAHAADRLGDLANRTGKTPNQIIQLLMGNAATSSTLRSNPDSHRPSSALKGRDYARLGEMGTLTGTLVQQDNEWGLQVGDRVYDIHLGPIEFRADKGFTLTNGENATISGFVYQTHVSVTSIETGGKSIILRDETGRPSWAGQGRRAFGSSL